MRKLTKCAVSCSAAIMAASMMFGMAAMAQEESDVIAIPYLEEGAFDEIVMTNDDTVETGINIRKSADANSEVVGHLYRGGAAWVINRARSGQRFVPAISQVLLITIILYMEMM